MIMSCRIRKSKVNTLRRLYISGKPVNKCEIARQLKIDDTTVSNYFKEFERVKAHDPSKLKRMNFFMPTNYIRKINKRREELLELLPEIVRSVRMKHLNASLIWRTYRERLSKGYSLRMFRQLFLQWCKENNVALTFTQYIETIPEAEQKTLKIWRNSNNHRNWQIAVIIQSAYERLSLEEIGKKVELNRATISRWLKIYNTRGLEGLINHEPRKNDVAAVRVQTKKDNILKLIHQSPSLYGINKTRWTTDTLAETYRKLHGGRMSGSNISKYLRLMGYAFKRSREMLTSPDLKFREKIKKIQDILQHLKPNEKFFSIDEYGPVTIKLKGGVALLHESEQPKTIPQHQKHRGIVICTAALELSTNQVTHFYSNYKNSTEMIKLVDTLVEQYNDQKKLYLCWDAASWHNSFLLKSHIEAINQKDHRAKHHTPVVLLAPLPSSTQFLNVIESVFSGLARSVIHNSDYRDVDECKKAIDLYLAERNHHFLEDPKRAGNKIWGKELVRPVFSESQHCRDLNKMRGNTKI
jgi:transposase